METPQVDPVDQLNQALAAEQLAVAELQNQIAELQRTHAEETTAFRQRASEHEAMEAALKDLYVSELAAVPESRRAHVEALCGHGTWAERLRAVRAAQMLLSTAESAGTRTQPAIANPAEHKLGTPMTWPRLSQVF